MSELPDYVVINKPECLNRNILRAPAQTVTFPLSEEDRHIMDVLITKFRNEKNCVGLAAPQLGFHKRLIVLEVKDDPKLKKWRPDLMDSLPQSLWINPSYTGSGEEKTLDYEGCFSVDGLGGMVARFKKIVYQGYDAEGRLIKGTAQGFLARVIQARQTGHTARQCRRAARAACPTAGPGSAAQTKHRSPRSVARGAAHF